ncbi:MAG TPA: tripartite tricarboxylate transporter substrate binding protein [Burkholderiales bacterium]|nr:tripartite tricarboxylate transporter substrate binding protein [Burkholderiales bacterium]
MRNLRILLAAGMALGAFAGSVATQDYPAKPVRIVVSSSAGGSPDIQIRLVTQKMTEANGYAWVIENLPGGGGNIAPERVAKSPPDGYTLLMASAGPLYINPSLYPGLPYDIVRDFEPITQISHTPNILVVHPSVPVKSVKELIAYAKANPGRLRFGSAGSGSSQHLSAELFKRMAGVELQHIPYKSSSQMTTELVAGQIELAFQNAPLVLPYVKAGRLVALAVTTKTRLASTPEVPTLDGSGLKGYDFGGGSALLAPKGTPPAILRKLESDARAALASASVREQFALNGLIPVGNASAEFAANLNAEIARIAPVVRASGAKVE